MGILRQTSKAYFQSLKLTHGAMLLGQIGMGVILVVLGAEQSNSEEASSINGKATYLMPLILAAGLLMGNFLFKKYVEEAKQTQSLYEKMRTYRKASIIRWAFLEGPTILSLIAYYLLHDMSFLLLAGAMLAFFATTFPSPPKAIQDLMLSAADQALVRKEDAIIADHNESRGQF